MSVTVDIIAGTSAGGINGVILGKALACNASQAALKQLWISEGDFKKLLRAPGIGGVKIRALLAAAGLLVHLRRPTSPLLGERMSRLLADLLADMDDRVEARAESAGPDASITLLPPQGTLDLYVTATDLHGFEVLVPTGLGARANTIAPTPKYLNSAPPIVTQASLATLPRLHSRSPQELPPASRVLSRR